MIDSDKAAANRRAREERKREYLSGMMDRYTARFRAAAGQEAPAIARDAHAAIELVLERDLKITPPDGDIRCRKGCSHCCHGPVDVWPQEAALLVEAARAAGVVIDRARLERQSGYTVDTWREQPVADRSCGFLGDDGVCKVYDSRPNACRKLLVTSDPELCDAEKHPPGSAVRWFSWEAEILDTAALETFGKGLMPVLLLAELAVVEAPPAVPQP